MTVKGFFGGLFIVIGALIAVLAGCCTIVLLEAFPSHADFGALILGGIPFIVGICIFVLGCKIGKKTHTNRYENNQETDTQQQDTQDKTDREVALRNNNKGIEKEKGIEDII